MWRTLRSLDPHPARRSDHRRHRPSVEGLEDRRLLAVAISELPASAIEQFPTAITAGPDGNLWFTAAPDHIGRITPGGTIIEFAAPGYSTLSEEQTHSITADPDGNLWFTEGRAGKIGRITLDGSITEFPLPTADSGPSDITLGPDGNLWFTEFNADKIGRITLTGNVTEFPVPTSSSGPFDITTGPDGNLWFTEGDADKIGRITPTGAATEFPLQRVGPPGIIGPRGITAGPDGNLWFGVLGSGDIGRINPGGTLTEFTTPSGPDLPFADTITVGPDGNLWFTDGGANKIGQITTAGTVSEFPVPRTPGGFLLGIATGPDGNLWFSEAGQADEIGRFNPASHAIDEFSLPAPDLALSGSAPGTVSPGQDVSVSLTVTNVSASAATGVTLTDTLPAGVTFLSATGGAIPVDGVLTFNLGDLAAGARVIVNIVVRPTATGTLTNRATVAANESDPTPDDNSVTLNSTVAAPVVPAVAGAQAVGVLGAPARIYVFFTAPLDPAGAEDTANYTLTTTGRRPHAIAIDAAIYDPATRSVTLVPHGHLSQILRYRLTVHIAGQSHPGPDFTTVLYGGGSPRWVAATAGGGLSAAAVDALFARPVRIAVARRHGH